MEEIPYEMVQEETQKYRDSVYRAREIVRERMRLAMGLSLRPQNRPSPLTSGVEASNISDKYYEPPLMQETHFSLLIVARPMESVSIAPTPHAFAHGRSFLEIASYGQTDLHFPHLIHFS